MLHKTVYKNSSFLRTCFKISQIWFKIVRQIKIHPKLPKDVLCLFSIYIFFKFQQSFLKILIKNLKTLSMEWHSIIHSFLFIMFCISPISGFSSFIFLSQNEFRRTTPMNMDENCLSQRSLFMTQICVTNETILLANERLQNFNSKLFTEYKWKLACFKGLHSWHGFVSRTKPFYSSTRC